MAVENNVQIEAKKKKQIFKKNRKIKKSKPNGLKFSQCMSQQYKQCYGNKMILVT